MSWGEWIKLPDGGVAHVRYSGRRPKLRHCQHCGRRATKQCDFRVAKGGTCDKWLCAGCAVPQGPNRDYCPDHPAQLVLFLGEGP